MFKKLGFWMDCLDLGLLPWRVEATSTEELERLRVQGAAELRQELMKLLKERHDANIGTESAIARACIRSGIITEIEQVLGKRRGTRYTMYYVRAGTTELLEVGADGMKIWFTMLVENLSLRQQEVIWSVL